jgi:hypothetical protein
MESSSSRFRQLDCAQILPGFPARFLLPSATVILLVLPENDRFRRPVSGLSPCLRFSCNPFKEKKLAPVVP